MQTSDYTLDLELHDGTEVIVKFDREVEYDLAKRVYFYTAGRFTVYNTKGEHIIEVSNYDRDFIEDECDEFVRDVHLDEDTLCY